MSPRSVDRLASKIRFLQVNGLYAILFRRAGIGCQFYEPPPGTPEPDPQVVWSRMDPWRDYLVVHRYYESIEAAVGAEVERVDALHEARRKGP